MMKTWLVSVRETNVLTVEGNLVLEILKITATDKQ